MRTCKWHILPSNVYNKWSASRVDPSPLLFRIFIKDLPLYLTRASVQCDLFADNGTLNTANGSIDDIRRDLQQSLYDVSGWCCKNRMALNPTKTKCMLMATRQKHHRKKKKSSFKSKVRDHANRAQSSGAVWKSRWPSWAPVPNKPYGFCGRKATLNNNRASFKTSPTWSNCRRAAKVANAY